MPVQVHAVGTRREMNRFIELPWRLYRDERLWVPPLRRDVREQFDPARNPFFRHAEVQAFVATSGGRIAGRIAAIANRAHNDFHGDRVGFFGFFECEDDPAAAAALFAAAENWIAERGLQTLRGPMSFSTNDECGSLIDGFDTPPVILMPHNPAYHAALYEKSGFRKAKDLLAYWIDAGAIPERLTRSAELLRKRTGAEIRSMRMNAFDDDVDLIWDIYNSAWEKNWGFVPMTREELAHMAAQLKPVVDPDLVLFVTVGNEPVAFALALPDLNVALKHAGGRLFPFGALAIWWHSRRIRRARILTLGIKAEHRGTGIDALLYLELFSRGLRAGYTGGEMSWVLEDNESMRRPIERIGGIVYKKYRVYERAVGGSAA